MSEKNDVWQDFQDTVNMTPGELEAWKDSDNYSAYQDKKSGGQEGTEPIDDAIRLLETPKSEWEDKDDGFNEVEQANELLAFTGRMGEVSPGDPILGTDPEISKQEASMLSWGVDPNPDRSDFSGDR
jgi:hypothetical protein